MAGSKGGRTDRKASGRPPLLPGLTGLTGTPGTGKSTVTGILAERGVPAVHLDRVTREAGAVRAYDRDRDTWEADLEIVAASLPAPRPLLVAGHLSHRLDVDRAIVLRCHPEVLRDRLASRDWPPAKVDENVEAEALGVILMEAMERTEVYEIVTTDRTPEETAFAVQEVLAGKGASHAPGHVDWSEAILSWY